jgi:uncharacterized protein YciI
MLTALKLRFYAPLGGLLLALGFCTAVAAQNPSPPGAPAAPPTEAPNNMHNYYFVMLTKGPNRNQTEAEAQQLQAGHMANMERMHAEGKLLVAGPFLEDGDWRGIFILNLPTAEAVENELRQDPAILAGRLAYTLKPWYSSARLLELAPAPASSTH